MMLPWLHLSCVHVNYWGEKNLTSFILVILKAFKEKLKSGIFFSFLRDNKIQLMSHNFKIKKNLVLS